MAYLYTKNDKVDDNEYFTDLEAISNVASIYNSANMTVTNMTSTGNVTVGGNLTTTGSFNLLPTGIIVAWTGQTVPAGWTLCNGTNGAPDLRDKFLVGAGNSYTIGNTGGANTVALTMDQMPKHSHSIRGCEAAGWARNALYFGMSDHGNDHLAGYTQPDNPTDVGYKGLDSQYPLGFTGNNAPHENRPPYYAVAYIMKL